MIWCFQVDKKNKNRVKLLLARSKRYARQNRWQEIYAWENKKIDMIEVQNKLKNYL